MTKRSKSRGKGKGNRKRFSRKNKKQKGGDVGCKAAKISVDPSLVPPSDFIDGSNSLYGNNRTRKSNKKTCAEKGPESEECKDKYYNSLMMAVSADLNDDKACDKEGVNLVSLAEDINEKFGKVGNKVPVATKIDYTGNSSFGTDVLFSTLSKVADIDTNKFFDVLSDSEKTEDFKSCISEKPFANNKQGFIKCFEKIGIRWHDSVINNDMLLLKYLNHFYKLMFKCMVVEDIPNKILDNRTLQGNSVDMFNNLSLDSTTINNEIQQIKTPLEEVSNMIDNTWYSASTASKIEQKIFRCQPVPQQWEEYENAWNAYEADQSSENTARLDVAEEALDACPGEDYWGSYYVVGPQCHMKWTSNIDVENQKKSGTTPVMCPRFRSWQEWWQEVQKISETSDPPKFRNCTEQDAQTFYEAACKGWEKQRKIVWDNMSEEDKNKVLDSIRNGNSTSKPPQKPEGEEGVQRFLAYIDSGVLSSPTSEPIAEDEITQEDQIEEIVNSGGILSSARSWLGFGGSKYVGGRVKRPLSEYWQIKGGDIGSMKSSKLNAKTDHIVKKLKDIQTVSNNSLLGAALQFEIMGYNPGQVLIHAASSSTETIMKELGRFSWFEKSFGRALLTYKRDTKGNITKISQNKAIRAATVVAYAAPLVSTIVTAAGYGGPALFQVTAFCSAFVAPGPYLVSLGANWMVLQSGAAIVSAATFAPLLIGGLAAAGVGVALARSSHSWTSIAGQLLKPAAFFGGTLAVLGGISRVTGNPVNAYFVIFCHSMTSSAPAFRAKICQSIVSSRDTKAGYMYLYEKLQQKRYLLIKKVCLRTSLDDVIDTLINMGYCNTIEGKIFEQDINSDNGDAFENVQKMNKRKDNILEYIILGYGNFLDAKMSKEQKEKIMTQMSSALSEIKAANMKTDKPGWLNKIRNAANSTLWNKIKEGVTGAINLISVQLGSLKENAEQINKLSKIILETRKLLGMWSDIPNADYTSHIKIKQQDLDSLKPTLKEVLGFYPVSYDKLSKTMYWNHISGMESLNNLFNKNADGVVTGWSQGRNDRDISSSEEFQELINYFDSIYIETNPNIPEGPTFADEMANTATKTKFENILNIRVAFFNKIVDELTDKGFKTDNAITSIFPCGSEYSETAPVDNESRDKMKKFFNDDNKYPSEAKSFYKVLVKILTEEADPGRRQEALESIKLGKNYFDKKREWFSMNPLFTHFNSYTYKKVTAENTLLSDIFPLPSNDNIGINYIEDTENKTDILTYIRSCTARCSSTFATSDPKASRIIGQEDFANTCIYGSEKDKKQASYIRNDGGAGVYIWEYIDYIMTHTMFHCHALSSWKELDEDDIKQCRVDSIYLLRLYLNIPLWVFVEAIIHQIYKSYSGGNKLFNKKKFEFDESDRLMENDETKRALKQISGLQLAKYSLDNFYQLKDESSSLLTFENALDVYKNGHDIESILDRPEWKTAISNIFTTIFKQADLPNQTGNNITFTSLSEEERDEFLSQLHKDLKTHLLDKFLQKQTLLVHNDPNQMSTKIIKNIQEYVEESYNEYNKKSDVLDAIGANEGGGLSIHEQLKVNISAFNHLFGTSDSNTYGLKDTNIDSTNQVNQVTVHEDSLLYLRKQEEERKSSMQLKYGAVTFLCTMAMHIALLHEDPELNEKWWQSVFGNVGAGGNTSWHCKFFNCDGIKNSFIKTSSTEFNAAIPEQFASLKDDTYNYNDEGELLDDKGNVMKKTKIEWADYYLQEAKKAVVKYDKQLEDTTAEQEAFDDKNLYTLASNVNKCLAVPYTYDSIEAKIKPTSGNSSAETSGNSSAETSYNVLDETEMNNLKTKLEERDLSLAEDLSKNKKGNYEYVQGSYTLSDGTTRKYERINTQVQEVRRQMHNKVKMKGRSKGYTALIERPSSLSEANNQRFQNLPDEYADGALVSRQFWLNLKKAADNPNSYGITDEEANALKAVIGSQEQYFKLEDTVMTQVETSFACRQAIDDFDKAVEDAQANADKIGPDRQQHLDKVTRQRDEAAERLKEVQDRADAVLKAVEEDRNNNRFTDINNAYDDFRKFIEECGNVVTKERLNLIKDFFQEVATGVEFEKAINKIKDKEVEAILREQKQMAGKDMSLEGTIKVVQEHEKRVRQKESDRKNWWGLITGLPSEAVTNMVGIAGEGKMGWMLGGMAIVMSLSKFKEENFYQKLKDAIFSEEDAEDAVMSLTSEACNTIVGRIKDRIEIIAKLDEMIENRIKKQRKEMEALLEKIDSSRAKSAGAVIQKRIDELEEWNKKSFYEKSRSAVSSTTSLVSDVTQLATSLNAGVTAIANLRKNFIDKVDEYSRSQDGGGDLMEQIKADKLKAESALQDARQVVFEAQNGKVLKNSKGEPVLDDDGNFQVDPENKEMNNVTRLKTFMMQQQKWVKEKTEILEQAEKQLEILSQSKKDRPNWYVDTTTGNIVLRDSTTTSPQTAAVVGALGTRENTESDVSGWSEEDVKTFLRTSIKAYKGAINQEKRKLDKVAHELKAAEDILSAKKEKLEKAEKANKEIQQNDQELQTILAGNQNTRAASLTALRNKVNGLSIPTISNDPVKNLNLPAVAGRGQGLPAPLIVNSPFAQNLTSGGGGIQYGGDGGGDDQLIEEIFCASDEPILETSILNNKQAIIDDNYKDFENINIDNEGSKLTTILYLRKRVKQFGPLALLEAVGINPELCKKVVMIDNNKNMKADQTLQDAVEQHKSDINDGFTVVGSKGGKTRKRKNKNHRSRKKSNKRKKRSRRKKRKNKTKKN